MTPDIPAPRRVKPKTAHVSRTKETRKLSNEDLAEILRNFGRYDPSLEGRKWDRGHSWTLPELLVEAADRLQSSRNG